MLGLAQSNVCSIRWAMATKDLLLYSALHGTAMRSAAEKRDLAESIAELHEIAGGRDDILAEAAGIEAGSWYAWPSTHVGHELVAAGLLIMASGHDGKPLDYDELERWTRVGYERGVRSRKGER
jgi:hypothetical protein